MDKFKDDVGIVAKAMMSEGLGGPIVGAPLSALVRGTGAGVLPTIVGTGSAMALGQAVFLAGYELATGEQLLVGPITSEGVPSARAMAINAVGSTVTSMGLRMFLFGTPFDAAEAGVMAGSFFGGQYALGYLAKM